MGHQLATSVPTAGAFAFCFLSLALVLWRQLAITPPERRRRLLIPSAILLALPLIAPLILSYSLHGFYVVFGDIGLAITAASPVLVRELRRQPTEQRVRFAGRARFAFMGTFLAVMICLLIPEMFF